MIDSHVFLWWLADHESLGSAARELISDPRNQVVVSAASVWEISIKHAQGKLDIENDLERLVEDEGFDKLSISLFHAQQAARLAPIHRDPFDRMLVAQAQAEGLELMTADLTIPQYGVQIVAARK